MGDSPMCGLPILPCSTVILRAVYDELTILEVLGTEIKSVPTCVFSSSEERISVKVTLLLKTEAITVKKRVLV